MNQKSLTIIILVMGYMFSILTMEEGIKKEAEALSKKRKHIETTSAINLAMPVKSCLGEESIDINQIVGTLDLYKKESLTLSTYKELLERRVEEKLPLIIIVTAIFNKNLEKITYRSYEAYGFLRCYLNKQFYCRVYKSVAGRFKDPDTNLFPTMLSPYFFAIWSPDEEARYLGNYRSFIDDKKKLAHLLNAFLPSEFIEPGDNQAPLKATSIYLEQLGDTESTCILSKAQKKEYYTLTQRLLQAACSRKNTDDTLFAEVSYLASIILKKCSQDKTNL